MQEYEIEAIADYHPPGNRCLATAHSFTIQCRCLPSTISLPFISL